MLILVHAIMLGDLVFVTLQGVNAIATGTIVVLTGRYKDHICTTHLQWFARASESGKGS